MSVQDGRQKEILQKIQARGQESDSDVIYITQENEILLDWRSTSAPDLIEVMSIGKSIVALAFGKLKDQRKIDSLDIPLYQFYPEWHQGQKSQITLRMILDHTSGLQTVPGGDEISRAPDCVKLALAAEINTPPGETFFYNNKAVNLLSDLVHQLSGLKVDDFVQQHLFDPLDIREKGWNRDKVGTPYSLGGIQLKAKDLHKIGRLVLDNGSWQGQQIVHEDWLQELLTPSRQSNYTCGLQWWIYKNPQLYAAQGYKGQWLYILPEKKIVALRQLKLGKCSLDHVDEFEDFRDLVCQL